MSKDSNLFLGNVNSTIGYPKTFAKRDLSDNVEILSLKINQIIKGFFSKTASFFQPFIGYFNSTPQKIDNKNLTQNLFDDKDVDDGTEEITEEDGKAQIPQTTYGYLKDKIINLNWKKIAIYSAGIGTVLAVGYLGYYYLSAASIAEKVVSETTDRGIEGALKDGTEWIIKNGNIANNITSASMPINSSVPNFFSKAADSTSHLFNLGIDANRVGVSDKCLDDISCALSLPIKEPLVPNEGTTSVVTDVFNKVTNMFSKAPIVEEAPVSSYFPSILKNAADTTSHIVNLGTEANRVGVSDKCLDGISCALSLPIKEPLVPNEGTASFLTDLFSKVTNMFSKEPIVGAVPDSSYFSDMLEKTVDTTARIVNLGTEANGVAGKCSDGISCALMSLPIKETLVSNKGITSVVVDNFNKLTNIFSKAPTEMNASTSSYFSDILEKTVNATSYVFNLGTNANDICKESVMNSDVLTNNTISEGVVASFVKRNPFNILKSVGSWLLENGKKANGLNL